MERFWWALKYEGIKIKEYISLLQLRFEDNVREIAHILKEGS